MCSITEEGAEWIAKVAEKAHLKELNLYMNDMGDIGMKKVNSQSCMAPHPALNHRHLVNPRTGVIPFQEL
jgi:hypothetical protein